MICIFQKDWVKRGFMFYYATTSEINGYFKKIQFRNFLFLQYVTITSSTNKFLNNGMIQSPLKFFLYEIRGQP